MKTSVLFLFVLSLLAATSVTAQDRKTALETIAVAKAGDGTPCTQLTWKQGTENIAYYLVERSHDGKEFKQIALVFISEDPSFTDYKFRDKGYTAANEAVYYRIGLVNDRKELSYLPVRRMELSGSTATTEGSADASPGKK